MGNSQDIPPATSDRLVQGVPAPVVDKDHPCVLCGYNLRSLSFEAVCPECATPVRQSFLSDQLVFSNPAWLKKVATGTLIISIVAGISVTMLFLGMSKLEFGARQGTTVVDFVFFALFILALIGVFMLTTKCREVRTGLQNPPSRRVCRWATVIWAILVLCNGSFGIPQFNITNRILSEALTLGNMIGPIVVAASLMRFLSNIAHRSNSPNLRGLGSFIMYAIIAPPCLFIPYFIAEAIGLRTWMLEGVAICFATVTGFALPILTGFFLFLLNLALHEDLKNAQAISKPIDAKHESVPGMVTKR